MNNFENSKTFIIVDKCIIYIYKMSGDFVIKYGTPSCNIDVTEIALQRCVRGNLLYIPADDCMRAVKFTIFASHDL